MGARAPNISLELLSARAALKKKVGLGSAATKDLPWKRIRPTAERLAEQLVSHASHATMLQEALRWRTVSIGTPIPDPSLLSCVHL
eukprot:2520935-Amphidinium_carterae.1